MCGDVTAAYLQALLGGVPVYMLLPMSLWPQWWLQQHFYQPVVRLVKAIYGMHRSGFDWGAKARRVLAETEFQSISKGRLQINRDGNPCVRSKAQDHELMAQTEKDQVIVTSVI